MDNILKKLEHPKRINELKPAQTLKKIGVHNNSVVLDYGAGTGLFTIETANISDNQIYAYDINDKMLQIISNKKNEGNHSNIQLIKEGEVKDIPQKSVDNILLVTVYHEISNKDEMFSHFDHVLKSDGTISVIEFHKKLAKMGPPYDERVSKDELINELNNRNYKSTLINDLGDNLYLASFKRK